MIDDVGYAKLNLALHVRRRRPDGYHDLETLFAFCEAGDGLSAEPADTLGLTIEGPFGAGLSAGPDNLVLRAAAALRAAAGIDAGAAIRLDKRLPVAAGIGGGSADAAAALRVLARLWTLAPDAADLRALAAGLGADVPACLESRSCRGEARGDALVPVADEALRGTPVLLVNPRVPTLTGPVFRAWDGVDRGPLATGDALLAIARAGRNDLEAPAIRLEPVIATAVAALAACAGVVLARMSGSGATCFALFESSAARDAAAATIAADHPGWWQLATRLR
ncbi:4-(cytidine 5'-diphospho)-2-C-methyl-D-erythritol kinase [Sphingomonas morindae]|uniref:4-diphosphocytidyl-2-C-methyl-D-erythritol kinase n=1 Tax=Sphingomonas morindae TaxID=1541170 RepID=A0ABY4X4P9_9SPHN|nr:4-(cytidine 5'-diphospho)-2-C-methyl-D-erythritol kinase [Sphingomonas morindae]USI71877.1 4-(cytidine 5'-diphospho)-2-C-methyl-D-erythritol kinase [Sphingomonas morindae]